MEDLYDRVSSFKKDLGPLHSHMTKLQSACVSEKRDVFLLVDGLYITAEYVDNEFYKKLKEVHAKPHQISVLHLRSYNSELPERVKAVWKQVAAWHTHDSECLIPRFATRVVEEVLPRFNSAFKDDPDRAYGALFALIGKFVDEMQGSRSFLKVPIS